MRLLILGASGGCGRWLVRLAAARGHEVTALVRDPAARATLQPSRVIVGDVRDASVLAAGLRGQDAVLSALGLRRVGRNPWARLLSPPDFTTQVARTLIPAMQQEGVSRLIVISAAGVAESLAQCSAAVRTLVRAGNVGVAYRDLAEMEATLANSDRDWLAVRPVTLLDGPPRRRARPAVRYGMFSTIRRSEVATWMLDALTMPTPFTARTVLLDGGTR